ncbi:GntR family transcriptional regulator [Halomonas sp.]|uniref:GntR family transcriptional regulator n=1 Tax=unclassified Halomonas TaxID=2609666 RepID=UPI003F9375F5
MSTIKEETHGLAAERVASGLYDEILKGQLQAGTRLGEVALAERFCVSRGPVRMALKSLSECGLVTIVPNSGAHVREMRYEDARAIYQVRAALEAEAAMLAASRANASTADEYLTLLQLHASQVTSHPEGAYLQESEECDFHLITARMSGNPLIQRYLTHELRPQLTLLRNKHRHVTGRGKIALYEHERIASAISEGDVEVAGLLMRRHIQSSWEALEEQLPKRDALN